MRMWFMLATLVVSVFSSNAHSAEPPKSVAVLPLRSKGKIDRELANVLDDLLLSSLQRALGGSTRVLGQTDMDAMLGFEKTKDSLGCDSVSCAVEIGGALGVESLLYGTLSKLGKSYVLTLSWIRQGDASVLNRHSETFAASDEELAPGVSRAVAALTKTAAPAGAPAVPAATPTVAAPDAKDPLAAWEVLNGTWYVADGAIYGTAGDSGGHLMLKDAPRDYRLSVTVQYVNGDPGATLGVGWRSMVFPGGPKTLRNGTSGLQCYGFNFAFSGIWRVFRGSGGNWFAVSSNEPKWAISPLIKQDKNRVVIEVRGSEHKITVNGTEIFKFSDASLPFGPPLFATHFAGNVVRFSDVKVEPL